MVVLVESLHLHSVLLSFVFFFFLSLASPYFIKLLLFLKILQLYCKVCGILIPRPGVEPIPPAVQGQSFNHWTTREVP